ncbi:MAG TPA: aldose epimerase [Opitutaceae bacterium]|nr:aldose epimerase [Opitutaceae bacterium]
MEKLPYLGKEIGRWQSGPSTFLAMPEAGARLMNWNVTLGDGSVRDLLYWPELQSLDDFHKVRGGNPILFPFSGRSFDRGEFGYWLDNGVRRPMPMHGIARQGKFKLTRCDAGGFTALFQPDAAAREAYPFSYEFEVSYRFAKLGFSVEFALRNLDRQPIPWSAGHHFYFTVPWSEGAKRADYEVRIPAKSAVRQTAAGALEGAAPLNTASLDNPSLIDLIHTGLAAPTAILAEHGGSKIDIEIGTGKHVPEGATFVTWTQSTESPFYCLEPWMGPPNAAEHGIGLARVQPGDVQKFVVKVEMEL